MVDAEDAVVCTYRLEGAMPLQDAARVVAMEQSTGTWTKVPVRAGSRERDLSAWVESTDPGLGVARVAFPLEIFEVENLPGVLAIIAGNLFGLGSLRQARLEDVAFPAGFAQSYPGPAFGVEGVRRRVGTLRNGRPHGGTIVKPKVGLDPKATAAVAKEAALGGIDLIKDDETLTDQAFCPLAERARLVLDALDEAKSETGKACLYAINLTAGAADIAERWDRVQPYGPTCAMVDVVTAGFDALRTLRGVANVPLHVHRAMHGALTRSREFGIDMVVLARLARLCGADQLHVGSAAGKMGHAGPLAPVLDALRSGFHGKLPVLAVSSGGLHPALVPREVEAFGGDVCIQAGGGVHGHPGGTRAGAKALMAAIDATAAGFPLEKSPSPELAAALGKWGGETYDYRE